MSHVKIPPIHEQIRNARLAAGWTQRQLGAALGIADERTALRSSSAQSNIARLEAGAVDPKVSTVARIAAALGVRFTIDGASVGPFSDEGNA